MDLNQVTDYVLAAGLTDKLSIQKNNNHLKFSCPFAQWTHEGSDANPSFTVSVHDDGASTFRCFGCGQKGKFWQLFTTLSIYSGSDQLREMGQALMAEESRPSTLISRVVGGLGTPQYVREVYDMDPLWNWFDTNLPNATVCNPGGHYLIQRGFDSRTWRDFGCRWDERDNRVVFPVYTLAGKFVGASGRTLGEDDNKWKHYWGTRTELGFVSPVYYEGETKTYILVEGPFDAMRCWQHLTKLGLAGIVMPVAISGCSISREQIDQIELEQLLTWVMFDNDTAGNKGANQAHKLLERRVPCCEDLTEKLPPNKDPNELQLHEFRETISL